ncbi:MAG: isochorismatase family protein [Mangrovibacterium sp.]
MRITTENTIGLIIDLQEKLVPAMDGADFLLQQNETLIHGLQELGVPLLVSQQYTKGLGETVPRIQSILKDFNPIEKVEYSCYQVPEFVAKCNQLGAQNIIISGIESHVCVLLTAVDLKEAGFNPIVVLDAVSSRSMDNLDIATDRLRHEGIMVTSVESILFELTSSAANPHFKAISKLVK